MKGFALFPGDFSSLRSPVRRLLFLVYQRIYTADKDGHKEKFYNGTGQQRDKRSKWLQL